MAFSVVAQKKETASFSGVEKINLATGSGSARIIKGSGKEVKVTVEHTYDEGDVDFNMDLRGSMLDLEEKFLANRVSGWSKWTVEVPDGMDFRFNTGSGDLEIEGLDLEIKSNLGSGSVTLTDTKGYARIATGSGSHEIMNHVGDMEITTGSGDIDVTSASGDLQFSTGSGDIDIRSAKGDIAATVGSGRVTAKELALNSYGKFTSGSGDVRVALNADTEARVTLASGSGDAVLDLGGKTINATIVMEANERYGRIVAPFKFDSEEVIERSGNNNDTIRKTVKLGNGKADIRISTGSGTAEIKK